MRLHRRLPNRRDGRASGRCPRHRIREQARQGRGPRPRPGRGGDNQPRRDHDGTPRHTDRTHRAGPTARTPLINRLTRRHTRRLRGCRLPRLFIVPLPAACRGNTYVSGCGPHPGAPTLVFDRSHRLIAEWPGSTYLVAQVTCLRPGRRGVRPGLRRVHPQAPGHPARCLTRGNEGGFPLTLADSRNRRVVHDRHWGQHQSNVGNPRAGTKQRLWPARCRWPGSASSVSRTRIRRAAGGPMRTLTHKPATTAALGSCHATRSAAGALRRPEPSGQRVGIGRAFLRLHQEGDTK